MKGGNKIMKISELNVGQGNVEVEGVLSEIGETRTFNKFGRDLSVANGMLKDDSGSIKMSLWNDDVTRFKDGDTIKVINGFVNEFQGEKQLTSGKFGSLEKVGEGSSNSAPEGPTEEVSEPEAAVSEESPKDSTEF